MGSGCMKYSYIKVNKVSYGSGFTFDGKMSTKTPDELFDMLNKKFKELYIENVNVKAELSQLKRKEVRANQKKDELLKSLTAEKEKLLNTVKYYANPNTYGKFEYGNSIIKAEDREVLHCEKYGARKFAGKRARKVLEEIND